MDSEYTEKKIIVKNWLEREGDNRTREYYNIWYSPDKKYAVAEISPGEKCLAFIVGEPCGDCLTGIYVDMYDENSWDVDFRSFDVDWSGIGKGYAKLTCFETESGFNGTKCTFYFDIDLYKRKYEEENGVPYSGNKSFRNIRTCIDHRKEN